MQESLNVLSEIFDDKEQMWSQRALSAWQTLKTAVLAQQSTNNSSTCASQIADTVTVGCN